MYEHQFDITGFCNICLKHHDVVRDHCILLTDEELQDLVDARRAEIECDWEFDQYHAPE